METDQTDLVSNQPPPLVDYDLFTTDPVLPSAIASEGAGWAAADLSEFGARLGQADTLALGAIANRNPPILHSFDRYGRRRDEVEFHPAWHELMTLAVGQGLHSAPWADPKTGAHVARGAGVMLMCQVEAGVQCPVTMTYGSVPALRRQSGIAARDIGAQIAAALLFRHPHADQRAGFFGGRAVSRRIGCRASIPEATIPGFALPPKKPARWSAWG